MRELALVSGAGTDGHVTRFLLVLMGAIPVVWWRRLRMGPRRPTWSFTFEVVVHALRVDLRRLARLAVPELREQLRQLRGPVAPHVRAERATIAGIPVLWFHPRVSDSRRLTIYAHGGGHLAGSSEQDRALASKLAALMASPVVAVDYRLAPESVAPADRDDLIAVYLTLRESYEDITCVGLSAGGGTVLGALIELRARNEALPSRAVLLSPLVDATASRPSWFDNAETDYGIREVVEGWSRVYAGRRSPADPLVSPINAPLHGLPSLLIVVGQAELLRDDATVLATRAEAAGVEVMLHLAEDQPHAFLALGLDNSATRNTFNVIKTFTLGSP
jgi:epsilon-lactone hydrolase